MADHNDEARSWLDHPMDAEELRSLLEQVKAALEAYDGPLCQGDLARRVEADRAQSPAVRL